MSGEAMAGITIGSFIAPGIGSVIGGAIGGWIGGNKQQKAIEAIIEKYQKPEVNFLKNGNLYYESSTLN
jgi:phage tail tape-measure protein